MTTLHNPKLYQHSGKLGFSPLLLAVLGIPIIIVLSFIYSYLVLYIPLAGYVTILLLIGYAFGIFLTISMIAKAGNCRNTTALKIFGLIGGLIALYFTWVSFIYALLGRFAPDASVSVAHLILNPVFLLESILFVNENGWYSIKGLTPTGIMLWIFWAIEAAVIVGSPVLFATSSIDDEMFCENCNKWCNSTTEKFRGISPSIESSATKNIDPITLSALPELPQKTIPCIREELLKCLHCNKTQGLRYSKVVFTFDKNNQPKEDAEKIKGIVIQSFN